jgi:hypothetical protein
MVIKNSPDKDILFEELTMETTEKGLYAIRQLRCELQEEAGHDFPQALHTEMLVLYDVCRCLDLNIFQCQEVLGEVGWAYINGYLEQRIDVKP